jgi:hypothetical protein
VHRGNEAANPAVLVLEDVHTWGWTAASLDPRIGQEEIAATRQDVGKLLHGNR